MNKFVIALFLFLPSFWAIASSDHNHAAKPIDDAKAVSETLPMTPGEVKKIHKEAGKVTIKHGEIKNLEMPAMTMVFRVKNAAMLEQLKTGDSVSFAVENINGNLTITKIEITK